MLPPPLPPLYEDPLFQAICFIIFLQVLAFVLLLKEGERRKTETRKYVRTALRADRKLRR